jgi:adenosylcobinamide-phosphate synthase
MRFLVLLLALGLDGLLGDPPNQWHPVTAMGTFIRRMALRAPAGGPAEQFRYGTGLMLAGLATFALPLAALEVATRRRPLVRAALEAVLLKSVFSMRRLLEAGREVEQALEAGDLPEARRAVRWHLVSRDTSALDEAQVASAAVESLAENLADSFVAPLLAYAVGGLPLAWAYRFANTADAMIGYHDERHEYLGKFAARLDDALNWLPGRLSGGLLAVAAPFAGGQTSEAWRTMAEQHGRTSSPNAGWGMSAAAGGLGVTLEKFGHYRLEGGPALPSATTLRRARRLVLAAAILGAGLAGLLCLRREHRA